MITFNRFLFLSVVCSFFIYFSVLKQKGIKSTRVHKRQKDRVTRNKRDMGGIYSTKETKGTQKQCVYVRQRKLDIEINNNIIHILGCMHHSYTIGVTIESERRRQIYIYIEKAQGERLDEIGVCQRVPGNEEELKLQQYNRKTTQKPRMNVG